MIGGSKYMYLIVESYNLILQSILALSAKGCMADSLLGAWTRWPGGSSWCSPLSSFPLSWLLEAVYKQIYCYYHYIEITTSDAHYISCCVCPCWCVDISVILINGRIAYSTIQTLLYIQRLNLRRLSASFYNHLCLKFLRSQAKKKREE